MRTEYHGVQEETFDLALTIPEGLALMNFLAGTRIVGIPEHLDIKALHSAYRGLCMVFRGGGDGPSTGHQ